MITFILICCIIYIYDQKFIKPRVIARNHADIYYKMCTPPPILYINKRTNTWETREYTDNEKWNICYKEHLQIIKKRGW